MEKLTMDQVTITQQSQRLSDRIIRMEADAQVQRPRISGSILAESPTGISQAAPRRKSPAKAGKRTSQAVWQ